MAAYAYSYQTICETYCQVIRLAKQHSHKAINPTLNSGIGSDLGLYELDEIAFQIDFERLFSVKDGATNNQTRPEPCIGDYIVSALIGKYTTRKNVEIDLLLS